jgi:glycosyltransferase involved in cell wall biosynthesis
MQPKISFIIPVHNIGKQLLSKCLDSCLRQSYSNIEVVIVNDCSPNIEDYETIDAFVLRFPDKVKAILHKYNQRQGAARNTGVQNSVGDYIIFVDADDYVDSKLCEALVQVTKTDDYDVVYCSQYRYVSSGKIETHDWFKNIDLSVISDAKSTQTDKLREIIRFSTSVFLTSIWGILIKKEFIKRCNIMFTSEKVEDIVYAFKLILLSDKICLIDDCYYNYLQRNQSDSYYNLLDVNMEWQKALLCFKERLLLNEECIFYINLYILNYM